MRCMLYYALSSVPAKRHAPAPSLSAPAQPGDLAVLHTRPSTPLPRAGSTRPCRIKAGSLTVMSTASLMSRHTSRHDRE
eukprot:296199-Chlamydomonas_euryale.AAC.2